MEHPYLEAVRTDAAGFCLGDGGEQTAHFSSLETFASREMEERPQNRPANCPQTELEPARRDHERRKKTS